MESRDLRVPQCLLRSPWNSPSIPARRTYTPLAAPGPALASRACDRDASRGQRRPRIRHESNADPRRRIRGIRILPRIKRPRDARHIGNLDPRHTPDLRMLLPRLTTTLPAIPHARAMLSVDGRCESAVRSDADARLPPAPCRRRRPAPCLRGWAQVQRLSGPVEPRRRDHVRLPRQNVTRSNTADVDTFLGKARFYEGTLPADFIRKNGETLAEDRRSTTTQPPFWDGTGTDHNLSVAWDCTAGNDLRTLLPTPALIKPCREPPQ